MFWQLSFWTDWQAWLRDIAIAAILLMIWWVINKRKAKQ